MHARLLLITLSCCCSFSFCVAQNQPTPTPAAAPLAAPNATPSVTSTPADALAHLTSPTDATAAVSPASASLASHESLPLPNSRLNIPDVANKTAATSSPTPDESENSSSKKKEETIPANALARLRAAREKFQAMKEATHAAASQISPAPQPSIAPISPVSAISTVVPAVSPAVPVAAPAAVAATSTPINLDEKITMQFPHTSILEVLSLYEKLTGKHIIRDSDLAGPELSIMIADPISKKEAINVIESSMLLNGYAVVPVDEKTVKVLGQHRPPRTEGLPLYLEETELPTEGDQIVSFYQPLHFLSTSEAINILQGVVQLNPFGSLVAVPNTSAIVITDKTPIIRKALALLKVIDHESSQIITEFVPLQRADAEKTIDILNQIFGKESTPSAATKAPGQPNTPPAPNQPPAVDTSSAADERVFSGKVQFIPDKRTNRILVVTRAENYRYVRELISNLDQAQAAEEPLVRPLNYMSSSDVFPVLVEMLKNKDDDTTQTPTKPQSATQSAFNSGGAGGTAASPLSGGANPDGSGTPGGATTGSSSIGGGDRLKDTAQLAPPQSAIVGSTSLVADPTANTIIVYGPPESKAKARQIIDLLDRRPQQVYLAAVIGQMRLDEGMDYGASYLLHYQGFQTLASSILGAPAASALLNGVNTAFPGAGGANGGTTSTFANAAGVNNVVNGAGSGLTLFGSIGGSVDMYANFLESTGRFRTIARPTVYTSNNKKATILSGSKVPYQSSTLSSVVNGASTGTNQTANSITANVTYQDVLLKLEVIPLINSDKEVNLIIAQQNQTVNTIQTTINEKLGVNAPTIDTQELTTSVRIPSGSTIVLGGLIQEDKDTQEKGIPFLNKVPILGSLLGGHTQKSKSRTELVVMIQPIVIDSNASMQKASDHEGGNSDLGRDAKSFEKKLEPTPPPTPKKKKFKLFSLPKMKDY